MMNLRYPPLVLKVQISRLSFLKCLRCPHFAEITWCGLRIYIHSLNVAMDCSRFEQGGETHPWIRVTRLNGRQI